MKCFLGDYVVTKNHNFKGRVVQKDHYFKGTQEWLGQQEIGVHPILLNEPWYHVLVHGRGCVYVNESQLEKIEPFDFTNDSSNFYLGENK